MILERSKLSTGDRSSDHLQEAHSWFHTHDSQQVLESRWMEEQSFGPKGPFCIPLPHYSPLVVPELPMMASICPLLTLKLRFWTPGSQESLWDVQGILNWASCWNQGTWEATSTWGETLAGSSESRMARGFSNFCSALYRRHPPTDTQQAWAAPTQGLPNVEAGHGKHVQ